MVVDGRSDDGGSVDRVGVGAGVVGCDVDSEAGKQKNIDCGKADGGVGLGAVTHTAGRSTFATG